MLDQHEHTGTVSVQHRVGIGWDTIDRDTWVYERQWISADNGVIRLENQGIGQEIAGPEVMDVLLLQIGDNRIIIGRVNCAVVRLKSAPWISQPIGPDLYSQVNEQ